MTFFIFFGKKARVYYTLSISGGGGGRPSLDSPLGQWGDERGGEVQGRSQDLAEGTINYFSDMEISEIHGKAICTSYMH